MTSVKWIKINVDMFDDEKIKIIQAMPEGDSLLVVWIKLITLAGKTNNGGYVYMSDNIPYTEEMLSTIMNKPLNIIKLALQTFIHLGMIENDERGIYLINFEKHQSLDRMAELKEYNRLAQQKHREKVRLSMESTKCQYCGEEATGYDHIIARNNGGTDDDYNKVPCCPTCNKRKSTMDVDEFLNSNLDRINIDIVKNNNKLSKFIKYNGKTFEKVNDSQLFCQRCQDIDIDIDKELDKDIYILYENEIGELNSKKYEELNNLIDKYGKDKVTDAINISIKNNKKSFEYIKAILNNGIYKKKEKETPEWLNKENKSELIDPDELEELNKEFEMFE